MQPCAPCGLCRRWQGHTAPRAGLLDRILSPPPPPSVPNPSLVEARLRTAAMTQVPRQGYRPSGPGRRGAGNRVRPAIAKSSAAAQATPTRGTSRMARTTVTLPRVAQRYDALLFALCAPSWRERAPAKMRALFAWTRKFGAPRGGCRQWDQAAGYVCSTPRKRPISKTTLTAASLPTPCCQIGRQNFPELH